MPLIATSITFFIYCFIVIYAYYHVRYRWQNILLLLASYLFYASWDWRYLFLIFITTVVDYYCGLRIHNKKDKSQAKFFLLISVIVNLSILSFFKYSNFFISGLSDLLSILGMHPNIHSLEIVLPIGMSFYIFKSLTYTIDIYRGKTEPTRSIIDYALFVSFFPALIAGPIDRAESFLPQIVKQRQMNKNQILDGLQLIMWGLTLKVFVADNLAMIVDSVFQDNLSPGALYIVATWAFAFQLYADFAGYSAIAIGIARCMGIELMQNFRQPYFATNPADFWQRWHISLSSWLRDYVYIPLGGNRHGKWRTQWNSLITMLLCGLWHGAAWHYILWGLYHGILLSIHRFVKYWKLSIPFKCLYPLAAIFKIFIMFHLICIGWVFFRASDLNQILNIFIQIYNMHWPLPLSTNVIWKTIFFSSIPVIGMTISTLLELKPTLFRSNRFLEHFSIKKLPLPVQTIVYSIFIYIIFFHGIKTQSFIYMKF